LRDLARRAGVSHAAPAHHFGDKAALLTAVAVDGYERLAERLRAARSAGTFLDVGVAYVQFAVEERGYFEVMYRPELFHPDDPDLRAARARTSAELYPPVAALGRGDPEFATLPAGVAAWSLVHGLATLWLSGNLPPQLGNDPTAIARDVARYLFRPGPRADAP
jgi:AcrR family transcriptional regulator